jgi:hypothetical protein
MTIAASRRARVRELLTFGYVRKRDGELALALSAMKLLEARALVAKTREVLRRLSGL